uniref:Uncharacterized protein n=1 Tax=Setaria digitata TaxID=48799 RepID=A0A915PKG6_9BILA
MGYKRLKRQYTPFMNTAEPVYHSHNLALPAQTYFPFAIPGYLPNYQGDGLTEIQAIEKTRALNAPFFYAAKYFIPN